MKQTLLNEKDKFIISDKNTFEYPRKVKETDQ